MNDGFLLDTNVPSELTKPEPDPAVLAWMNSQDLLYISVISIGEIRLGVSVLPFGKRRERLENWLDLFLLPLMKDTTIPVTHAIAERWASLGATCQNRGKALSMADGLIAATALEHNLTLVTCNTKDFTGLGVPIVNPWNPWNPSPPEVHP